MQRFLAVMLATLPVATIANAKLRGTMPKLKGVAPLLQISLKRKGTVTSDHIRFAAADALKVREFLGLRTERYDNTGRHYLGKHVRFHGEKKHDLYGGQITGYVVDADNKPALEVHVYDDLYPADVDRVQYIEPSQITGVFDDYSYVLNGTEVEVDNLISETENKIMKSKGTLLGSYNSVAWIHDEDEIGHYAVKVLIDKQMRLVFRNSVSCCSDKPISKIGD